MQTSPDGWWCCLLFRESQLLKFDGHVFTVTLHFHILVNFTQLPLGPEEECVATGETKGSIDAKVARGNTVWIAENWKWCAQLRCKFFHLLDAVTADDKHLDLELFDLLGTVTQSLALSGSARCEGLWNPCHDDAASLCTDLSERMLFTIGSL